MILAKFYQKFLPKCKILVSQAKRTVFCFVFVFCFVCFCFVLFCFVLCFCPSSGLNAPKSIHQIAQFQLQKIQNFLASEGGTTPLRHPPVCVSAQLALNATKSSPSHVDDGSTPLLKSLLARLIVRLETIQPADHEGCGSGSHASVLYLEPCQSSTS